MSSITSTGRRSPPPAPAAQQPSTRSGTSKRWATSLVVLAALVATSGCARATKELHGTKQDLPGGNVLAIQLFTPTAGWALTDSRFVATNNAGKDWHDLTPIDTPGSTLRGGYFYDAVRAWTIADQNGKLVVYRSASGGDSWLTSTFPRELGAYGGGTVTFRFISPTEGFVFVPFKDGGGAAFSTTDAGASWSEVAVPSATGTIRDVRFIDRLHGWATTTGPGNDGAVSRTEDGARTWTPVLRDSDERSFLSTPVFDKNIGTVVAAGPSGALTYTSADGGRTWTPGPATPAPGTRAAAPLFAGAVMVSGSSGAVQTSLWRDGAWTLVNASIPGAGAPLAVTAGSPLHIWASFRPSGTGKVGLYSTVDSGKTWVRLNA